jgi:murein DD-endopeptidase MepM/ murein hydrolase activator NlpD
MHDTRVPPPWRIPLLVACASVVFVAVFLFGPRLSRADASCDRPSAQSVTVGNGDTLQTIARSYYGSDTCAPVIAEENALSNPDQIYTGEILALSPASAVDLATARAHYSWGVAGGPRPSTPTPTPTPTEAPQVALAAPVSSLPQNPNGFIWPVVGPITQPFGVPELGVGLPHTGIDIGQDVGSPIRAAESGRVTFAGGDPCCGLGYWVEINHGNRYATRYGHMMRPPVVLVGDYVDQGQVIGFSGTTGFSTGPHVHFEIRLDGNPIDPLRLLPASP